MRTIEEIEAYQKLCNDQELFLEWKKTVDPNRIFHIGAMSPESGAASEVSGTMNELAEAHLKIFYYQEYCGPKTLSKI